MYLEGQAASASGRGEVEGDQGIVRKAELHEKCQVSRQGASAATESVFSCSAPGGDHPPLTCSGWFPAELPIEPGDFNFML